MSPERNAEMERQRRLEQERQAREQRERQKQENHRRWSEERRKEGAVDARSMDKHSEQKSADHADTFAKRCWKAADAAGTVGGLVSSFVPSVGDTSHQTKPVEAQPREVMERHLSDVDKQRRKEEQERFQHLQADSENLAEAKKQEDEALRDQIEKIREQEEKDRMRGGLHEKPPFS